MTRYKSAKVYSNDRQPPPTETRLKVVTLQCVPSSALYCYYGYYKNLT